MRCLKKSSLTTSMHDAGHSKMNDPIDAEVLHDACACWSLKSILS